MSANHHRGDVELGVMMDSGEEPEPWFDRFDAAPRATHLNLTNTGESPATQHQKQQHQTE